MASHPYTSYPYPSNNCPPPQSSHHHYNVPPPPPPGHHHHHHAQQHQHHPPAQMYMDYPLKGIPNPHAHDVLCGRGGQSNSHPGNMQWRTLVAANKELYVSLPKKQKMLLSQSIVNAVRSQHPPGRFLGKDTGVDTWHDVGDKRAQEKTSQALREGAPEIRKNLKDKETKPDKGKGKKKKGTAPPSETQSLERTESKEQMPPPSITIVPPPASFVVQESSDVAPAALKSEEPPERNIQKKPTESSPTDPEKTTSTYPQQQLVPNAVALETESAVDIGRPPPPPTQIVEGELSFGSIALMSDVDQAKLMHNFSLGSAMSYQQSYHPPPRSTIPESEPAYPPQDIFPQPVDGGLEPVGLSFGSMMSMGTAPNLERSGLSCGSTMSYTVSNDRTAQNYAGNNNTQHQRHLSNEYSGAPDLQDIGTSFGSLSLAPGERERIIKEAHDEVMESGAAAAPTFLKQQRSRGDLLYCSDSDSDDEEASAQASAQRSAGWEKLQAAMAAQKSSSLAPPPPLSSFGRLQQGGMHPPPPLQPPMFHVPTTNAIARDFSNMSAISIGDDFGTMTRSFSQQQANFDNTGSDDDDGEPLPFRGGIMPPPPPVMKKSDNWAGEELKMGYRYS